MSGAAPLLPQVSFMVSRGTGVCYLTQDGRTAVCYIAQDGRTAFCYLAQDGRTVVRTAQWYRMALFKISWNCVCCTTVGTGSLYCV